LIVLLHKLIRPFDGAGNTGHFLGMTTPAVLALIGGVVVEAKADNTGLALARLPLAAQLGVEALD
jgi:hypothetical protein